MSTSRGSQRSVVGARPASVPRRSFERLTRVWLLIEGVCAHLHTHSAPRRTSSRARLLTGTAVFFIFLRK